MRYNEDIVRSVIEANDLVELISQFVTLKKSGRNYMGCCPFHNEKTPSFSVSPDKQLYHCFGCGESGNIISFVKKMENIRFPEAIAYLAERGGITLPRSVDPQEEAKFQKKQRICEMHRQAANHYFRHLKKNSKAKKYLAKRGYGLETIRHYGLGVSDENWQDLVNLLTQAGFSESEMIESGLILRGKNGRCYDRFRNRIMIPILNIQDKIIGFGGREYLPEKSQGPKYLNSPETIVFSKSYELFNLNHAKKAIENDSLIVVEGYMDVIALYQHGIKNVVASLGTAFTPYHAKTLSRYVREVVLCFDGDVAGENATLKAIEILRNSPLDVRILRLDTKEDPDSFIQKNGADVFLKAVKNAGTITDFELSRLEKKYNLSHSDGRVKYLKDVINYIGKIDNPVEQEIYVIKAAESANVSQELLLKEVRKQHSGEMISEITDIIDQSNVRIPKAYREAQENILQMMIQGNKEISSQLKAKDFSQGIYRRIFELLSSEEGEKEVAMMIESLQVEEEKKMLATLTLNGKDMTDELVKESLAVIKKNSREKIEQAMVRKIRQEKEDEEKCLRQLDALARSLKN